jgi:uncharacterized protein YbcV (DUF1398 family)
MFTLEQVNEIHDELGKALTLAAYLRALRAIGVEKSESFITDGHTVHHGKDGHTVVTPPAHEVFTIAETSNRERFLECLEETNYQKMSKGLADSGVEKWTFDTHDLTIIYYDKAGNELLKEDIK